MHTWQGTVCTCILTLENVKLFYIKVFCYKTIFFSLTNQCFIFPVCCYDPTGHELQSAALFIFPGSIISMTRSNQCKLVSPLPCIEYTHAAHLLSCQRMCGSCMASWDGVILTLWCISSVLFYLFFIFLLAEYVTPRFLVTMQKYPFKY